MEPADHQPAGAQEKPAQRVFGKGMVMGICIIIVIAAFFIVFTITGGSGSVPTVSLQSCGQTVIGYLNSNLVQQGTSAELVFVTENHGVYEIMAHYQARDIQLYATKDCSLLFTNTIPIGSFGGCDSQAADRKSVV